MHIRIVSSIALAMIALAPLAATANCAGTPAFNVCLDASGNHTTTIRSGDSSHVSGGSIATGSTWSHETRSIGNTTFSEGRRNGHGWTRTDIDLGGGARATYGADSRGGAFGSVCGRYGCY